MQAVKPINELFIGAGQIVEQSYQQLCDLISGIGNSMVPADPDLDQSLNASTYITVKLGPSKEIKTRSDKTLRDFFNKMLNSQSTVARQVFKPDAVYKINVNWPTFMLPVLVL